MGTDSGHIALGRLGADVPSGEFERRWQRMAYPARMHLLARVYKASACCGWPRNHQSFAFAALGRGGHSLVERISGVGRPLPFRISRAQVYTMDCRKSKRPQLRQTLRLQWLIVSVWPNRDALAVSHGVRVRIACRWTPKRNPWGVLGRPNLYTYVYNEPINLVDINGLWTISLRLNISILFWDVQWNITYASDGTYENQRVTGIGFTPSASITGGITATTAETCTDLRGPGKVFGEQRGPNVVPVIGEANYVWGDGYDGIDVGIGLGLGAPFFQYFETETTGVN